MNKPGTYISLAFASLLLAAAGPTHGKESRPAASGRGLAGWSRVELHATKLIATADAVIERWPADGGAADPPQELVRVSTVMRYLGRSKTLITYSEHPPDCAPPLRWMEIEPGKYAREWRAAADGPVSKFRYGPPAGKKPPWKGPWTPGKSETYPVPASARPEGALAPLDAWTFLARLELVLQGPQRTVPLLGNAAVIPAIARRAGTTRLALRVRDLDAGREIPLELDAVRIELGPAPGGPSPAVLGMSGPVTLLVDPASGALLQLEGRKDGIPGVIRFTISAVSRTARPRPDVPWPGGARDGTTAP